MNQREEISQYYLHKGSGGKISIALKSMKSTSRNVGYSEWVPPYGKVATRRNNSVTSGVRGSGRT